MKNVVEDAGTIRLIDTFLTKPEKLAHKFENDDFVEFDFREEFKWDCEDYKNCFLPRNQDSNLKYYK